MCAPGAASKEDEMTTKIEVPLGPLAEIRRIAILAALDATGNCKAKAARLLGVSRRSLYAWLPDLHKPCAATVPPPRRRSPTQKLSDEDVAEIRRRSKTEKQAVLAREYGVSRQRVGQILRPQVSP